MSTLQSQNPLASNRTIVVEERCSKSIRQIAVATRGYFSWSDNYMNAQSFAFKSMNDIPFTHKILLNGAKYRNFTFFNKALENFEDTGAKLDNTTDLRSGVTFSKESFELSNSKLSYPYSFDFITFGVTAPEELVDKYGLIKSFSLTVWILLLLIILLSSFLLFILSYAHARINSTNKHTTLSEALAYMNESLIGQHGHDIAFENTRIRLFICLWLLMTFVICNLYQSYLVSNLLHVETAYVPQTFEELVPLKTTIVVDRKDMEIMEDYFQNSGSEMMKRLGGKLESASNKVKCLESVIDEKNNACAGYYGGRTGLKNAVTAHFTSAHGKPKVFVSRKGKSVAWIGFLIHEHLKIGPTISSFVLNVASAGLIDLWQDMEENLNFRVGQRRREFNKCSNGAELFFDWHGEQQEINNNQPFPDEVQTEFTCFTLNWATLVERIKLNCTLPSAPSSEEEDRGEQSQGQQAVETRKIQNDLIKLVHLKVIRSGYFIANFLAFFLFLWEARTVLQNCFTGLYLKLGNKVNQLLCGTIVDDFMGNNFVWEFTK